MLAQALGIMKNGISKNTITLMTPTMFTMMNTGGLERGKGHDNRIEQGVRLQLQFKCIDKYLRNVYAPKPKFTDKGHKA